MSERFTVDKGEDDNLPVFYDGEISITYDEVCQKLNEYHKTIIELNRRLYIDNSDFFDNMGLIFAFVDDKVLMKTDNVDSKWCEVKFKMTPFGDTMYEIKAYDGDEL